MKLKSNIFSQILYLISCVLILVSCDSTEPGKETLSLSLEDASSTEVWLKLNGSAEGEYVLQRDGMQVQQISLSGTDNIIYNDSLKPSTTYTYQLIGIQDQSASNEVTALTMDTTSHDFSWETFTFGGQGGSSALYDVAIIDENNIWAVGEIYTAEDKYNAAHWDGSEWELLKIEINNITYPLRNVFAFSYNDILFSNLSILHWDGSVFNIIEIPNEIYFGQQNGIWGASSSDFYVLGNNGNIAHYNGSNWEKIESGTQLNLYDIYGSNNINTDQNEILCVGSIVGFPSGNVILKINDHSVSEITATGINGSLTTLWFMPKRIYYFGSGDLYTKKRLDDSVEMLNPKITLYPVTSIYGSDINDVFITSAGGEVVHFNGVSYENYSYELGEGQTVYSTIKKDNNLVIAVGFKGNSAVINLGRE